MARMVFCALSFLLLFFPRITFASNVPDFHHSSIQSATADGEGQAPADGQTQLKVTVTMKDSNGTPLAGEGVSITCSDNAYLTITPPSTISDGSGQSFFYVTTFNSGTYSIDAINKTQNVTLGSLGKITFRSPFCSLAPPGSAPKLISATAISTTKILLKWTSAADPTTFYLLTYGTSSGSYVYGSANIGGHDATSYVVGELTPNKRYYFKIRAGNGCAPGAFSNEISAVTTLVSPIPSPVATIAPTPKVNPVLEITPKPTSNTLIPAVLPGEPVSFLIIIGSVITAGVALVIIGLFFYARGA